MDILTRIAFVFFLCAFASCCTDFVTVDDKSIFKYYYVEGEQEIHLKNQYGATLTLNTEEMICDFSPYVTQQEVCEKHRQELCGQNFVVSDGGNKSLDFSMSMAHNGQVAFLFNHDFGKGILCADIFPVYDSLIGGISYDQTIGIRLQARQSHQPEISRMLYAAGVGPVEIVMNDSTKWTRYE